MDWKNRFEQELRMAVEARSRGNEGQARVCARRAAGAVLRAYFQQQELPVHSPSVYDLLKELLANPNIPDQARKSAEYLTMSVNEEFNLPVDVDLIQAARDLADCLMPGKTATGDITL